MHVKVLLTIEVMKRITVMPNIIPNVGVLMHIFSLRLSPLKTPRG